MVCFEWAQAQSLDGDVTTSVDGGMVSIISLGFKR